MVEMYMRIMTPRFLYIMLLKMTEISRFRHFRVHLLLSQQIG